MNFLELLKVSFQALKTNKTRAGLTMLGVIIGVGAVILLISIGSGLKGYVIDQLEELGADSLFVIPGEISMGEGENRGGGIPGPGVAASKFTFDHLNDLKREGKTIKAVMAYTENNGTIKYRGETHVTQIAGVGPNYPTVRNQEVIQGSFFTSSQHNAAKKVAVLGKSVAEEFFEGENPLGKKVTVSDQRYVVIGVLEKKGSFARVDVDDQVFIPATTAMRQFDMDNVQSFWVQSQSSEMIPQTKEEVEKILMKTLDEDEFSILDTKSILTMISSILGALTAGLGGIAAISLLVGGIGIMNIMLVSVTERTREIGLRKAVGATPKNIMVQFLIEATILSLGGGIIGILLALAGSMVLSRFWPTTVSLWSVLVAFFVSAGVGVIFGVAPAAKAARLNPIDALKYE